MVLGLTFAGACQATVSASCQLFGANTTYTPLQRWPFDTVSIEVLWYPFCTNFSCVANPALVGVTAHIDGTTIHLDVYGSDDALPAGVPVSPPPARPNYPYFAVVPVVGPLAPGSYTVQGVVHGVTNGVDTELCPPLPSMATVVIERATGPVNFLTAVEFYSAARDHYFITSDAAEIADLDNGIHPGWSRTGQTINVFGANASGGVGVPVCRFYGLPSAGLDSHFYTADQAECADIPAKFHGAWVLESNDVFDVRMPDPLMGSCAVGFAPVYRLWNQRADSNHRYTTDVATKNAMIAKGYFPEGYGPDAVAMCAPN